MTRVRQRFRGRIAGIGSTSGTRVVVGRWLDTPFGPFADAMVETAAGHRVLLAPHRDAADFIRSTYTFDEVRIETSVSQVERMADRLNGLRSFGVGAIEHEKSRGFEERLELLRRLNL